MPLCANCGKQVGTQYVHDGLYDLDYCRDHSHFAGSSGAKTCLQCGQRVAKVFFLEDICPQCGANFKEAARTRYETARAPTLERLRGISFVQFLPFSLLSCIIMGSFLFVLLHFAGRLITPVLVAAIFVMLVSLPLVFDLVPSHGPKWGFWAKVHDSAPALIEVFLDFPGRLAENRIERAFVGGDYFSDDKLQDTLIGGFAVGGISFRAATVLSKLLLQTIGSLVVELVWPGYFHTLLVVSVIAIPVSILDALLFRRTIYAEIERAIGIESDTA
ncbi:MAG: hypothetical protein ACYCZF_16600 [Anaerolineae bacterium]